MDKVRSEPPVAIYVFGVRQTSKKSGLGHPARSHDALLWIGVEVLRDVLSRDGISVGYAGAATVNRHRVILVSITGVLEWYRFIRERATWPPGDYTVLIGGAAITNIEPFLPYFDCVAWGRAEGFITELVSMAINGERFRNDSVCWSDEYDRSDRHVVAQSSQLYPRPLRIGGDSVKKQTWSENAIGCAHKCGFCLYSWTHKAILPDGVEGQYNRSRESTFWNMDFDNPPRVSAIDGCSERLRLAVNKPIPRSLLVDTLKRLTTDAPYTGQMKLFNIVHYPSEREEDYAELAGVFDEAEGPPIPGRKKLSIELRCTPFSPEPCTPLACAPVRVTLWKRSDIARRLESHTSYPGNTPATWHNGDRLWGFQSSASLSTATVVLEVLTTRGVRNHTSVIRKLASSRKFQNANKQRQLATLREVIDVPTICGRYAWSDLPTANLHGIASPKKLDAMGQRMLAKLESK